MNLNILLKEAEVSMELKNHHINTLLEFLTYNSNGMVNYVIDVLEIFNKRISNNEKIIYEKTNKVLDIYSFKNLVLENFGEHVFEEVFKIKIN